MYVKIKMISTTKIVQDTLVNNYMYNINEKMEEILFCCCFCFTISFSTLHFSVIILLAMNQKNPKKNNVTFFDFEKVEKFQTCFF